MNESKTRNERIGNILLIAALVALSVALGALLIERQISLISEIAFGVAGALLIAFVIVEPTRTRTWVTSRQVRYGSNAVLMSLVLLAVLGVANFLADRHTYRVDVTANRTLSLSAETRAVLETLEGPVRVVAFLPESSGQARAADLLDQYRYRYPDWQVEFHDPLVEPSLARQWGLTDMDFYRSTLIVIYQERREDIHSVTELDITSALVRLSRASEPVIYFLTGHDEPGLENISDIGLSTLKERMEALGFRVAPLNLVVTATVPADASVVVVMGPRTPLTQDEVDRLAAYVDGGGRAVVLLEPAPNFEEAPSPLTTWLAERWNVAFENDLVFDPSAYAYPLPTIPLASSYGYGPVGQGMGRALTYFVEARSLRQVDAGANADLTFEPLVRTSAASWGETSKEQLADYPNSWPQYDEGVDIAGPLTIAATLEDAQSGARLAFFGDYHFCVNAAVSDGANADLFINTLNWLTQDDSLITLQPREDVARYVTIRSNLVRNAVFFVLIIVLPLTVLAIGVVVLVLRRVRR